MNKISMDKKYRTRGGLPVEILCTTRNNSTYPVVVLIDNIFVEVFTEDGKYSDSSTESSSDLIEIK